MGKQIAQAKVVHFDLSFLTLWWGFLFIGELPHSQGALADPQTLENLEPFLEKSRIIKTFVIVDGTLNFPCSKQAKAISSTCTKIVFPLTSWGANLSIFWQKFIKSLNTLTQYKRELLQPKISVKSCVSSPVTFTCITCMKTHQNKINLSLLIQNLFNIFLE